MIYKLMPNKGSGEASNTVQRLADLVYIPFEPANTDYQSFKQDIANGTELQDAEGQVMTAEQVAAFMETLP